MSFDNLQWHSVTTMHQVLSLFFGFSSPPFANHDFHVDASFLGHPFGTVRMMEINRSLHLKIESDVVEARVMFLNKVSINLVWKGEELQEVNTKLTKVEQKAEE